MAKLGVVPQQLAGGDIYPALEKGTIDAAEWVGPYDDQKLGFNKVAPYYYYPGWWEGSAALSLYVGLKSYEELPAVYKEAIASAAGETNVKSVAKYDVQNPKALRELVAGGTKFLPFPQSVLEASFNAANELYAETVAKNPKFKKVYEFLEALPQRGGSVVPRRREHLRQLHGAPVGRQQALSRASGLPEKAPSSGAFLCPLPEREMRNIADF